MPPLVRGVAYCHANDVTQHMDVKLMLSVFIPSSEMMCFQMSLFIIIRTNKYNIFHFGWGFIIFKLCDTGNFIHNFTTLSRH